jgi:hypothetical protein
VNSGSVKAGRKVTPLLAPVEKDPPFRLGMGGEEPVPAPTASDLAGTDPALGTS